MTIEQHIEELRAERRNAVDANERREIEEALELALAEQAASWAKSEGFFSTKPPH